MISTDLNYWNECFARLKIEGVREAADHQWLAPYVPLFRGQRIQKILEIGCGSGQDTVYLTQEGFDVTATDYSVNALTIVRDQLPDTSLLLHDVRDSYPFGDGSFDLVLASLSLHYFDPTTLEAILAEFKRLLRPRGLLLYRVNSVNDPMFGIGQCDMWESDMFVQEGVRRRYFFLDTCRETFRGWEEILLEEKTIDRYIKPKVLCEGLVRKAGLDPKNLSI